MHQEIENENLTATQNIDNIICNNNEVEDISELLISARKKHNSNLTNLKREEEISTMLTERELNDDYIAKLYANFTALYPRVTYDAPNTNRAVRLNYLCIAQKITKRKLNIVKDLIKELKSQLNRNKNDAKRLQLQNQILKNIIANTKNETEYEQCSRMLKTNNDCLNNLFSTSAELVKQMKYLDNCQDNLAQIVGKQDNKIKNLGRNVTTIEKTKLLLKQF